MQSRKFISFDKGLPLVLAVILSGCAAGLSQQECSTADWRTIGYEDGVQGRPEARIGDHRQACARHGVGLNFDAYRSGWEEGIQRYCQPGKGYQLGRRGKSYSGICPASLEEAFLQAYRQGHELYEAEVSVRRTVRKLSYKRKRLANIEVNMRDAGLELVAKGVSTERRIILLDELRKLEQERATTKAQIPALEAELERQTQHLATLNATQ